MKNIISILSLMTLLTHYDICALLSVQIKNKTSLALNVSIHYGGGGASTTQILKSNDTYKKSIERSNFGYPLSEIVVTTPHGNVVKKITKDELKRPTFYATIAQKDLLPRPLSVKIENKTNLVLNVLLNYADGETFRGGTINPNEPYKELIERANFSKPLTNIGITTPQGNLVKKFTQDDLTHSSFVAIITPKDLVPRPLSIGINNTTNLALNVSVNYAGGGSFTCGIAHPGKPYKALIERADFGNPLTEVLVTTPQGNLVKKITQDDLKHSSFVATIAQNNLTPQPVTVEIENKTNLALNVSVYYSGGKAGAGGMVNPNATYKALIERQNFGKPLTEILVTTPQNKVVKVFKKNAITSPLFAATIAQKNLISM